jgi:hypothetical protein
MTLSRVSPARRGQVVKVFWFFFSKKNRFLAYFAHNGTPWRRMAVSGS